jgi:hypothetical protein
MLIVLSASCITGCGNKKPAENLEVTLDDQGGASPTDASSEGSEQVSEDNTPVVDSASTTAIDDQKKAEEDAAKAKEQEQGGKKISVQSLVNDAKQYIKDKKVLESETLCDMLRTTMTGGRASYQHNWGVITSGFNDEFYYVEEHFESGSSEDYTTTMGTNTDYTFYVNENNGYITSLTGDYQIPTSVILNSAEVSDFKPATMAEFLLDTLVTDMEYCSISKDEDGNYVITQRLTYGDLAINNSNTWRGSGINKDESIREILHFDHDTHRLTGYEVECIVSDVKNNTEIKAQYQATYSYEKTAEFPDVEDEKYVVSDGFHGYSIY